MIEERQAAVQVTLNAGHIPAGMELFKADDESQWNIIKDWIEESDMCMLILGGRYGSIKPKTGKSYTQLEYEYAIENNKPFFAIVIKDDWTDKKAKKKGVKIEDITEFHNLSKLDEFKATVFTKIVKFAEDLKDIKLFVGESLNGMSIRDNLKGWVKADDTDFSSISEELARLSKENNELKSQLAELNKEEKINGINILEVVEYLRNNKIDEYSNYPYCIDLQWFISQNYLELFMGLTKRSSFVDLANANLNTIPELRFLMNLQLISDDGITTFQGALLVTYVIQNKVEWQNNVECNNPYSMNNLFI